MNTLSDPERQPANLTAIPPVATQAALKSLAVLEQMYGYFSFEPMPLETDRRLAA